MNNNDDDLTPEEIEQIQLSRKQIAEGKYTRYTLEEYIKHLEELDKEKS